MTDEDPRTRADERRWKEAREAAAAVVLPSWPQALRTARAKSDDQLRAAADGCTELSCPRHGAYNEVLRERGVLR